MCPPFHLVYFIEVNLEGFAARGKASEGPGAVVEEDGVGKCILQANMLEGREEMRGKS